MKRLKTFCNLPQQRAVMRLLLALGVAAGSAASIGSAAWAQSTPVVAQQSGAGINANIGGNINASAGASAGAGTGSDAAAGSAAGATNATNAARYVQACQEALRNGQTGLGCNGALFTNELRQLENQALQTRNPALLTLVGEVYRNDKMPGADMGQAYRWYLMAAVRGDALAMERLSQMYQRGAGVQADPVKALGYARLTQQFAAQQGRRGGSDIARTIQRLGSEMAAEELALSERFAQEMEARIAHGKAGGDAPTTSVAPAAKTTIPGAEGAYGAPGGSSAPAPVIRIPGLGQGEAALEQPAAEPQAQPVQQD